MSDPHQHPHAHEAGSAHPHGAPLSLVAALTEPPALPRLLAALGLAAEPPPRPPVTVEPGPSAASLARPSRPGRRSRLWAARPRVPP